MSIEHFSHLGLCVSDLPASIAFYCEALGFEPVHRIDVAGADAERLLGLSPVRLEAVYLKRDGVVIELLAFDAPGHVPREASEEPRPMNRVGLTHLSLRVADLDDAVAQVISAGGRVLDDTLVRRPASGMAVAFVLDPDGTRIELLQAPGDPKQLPGT